MLKNFQNPLFLLFAFSIIAFLGLKEPLWDQDEAAYFGFSSNMNQTTDWIVPDYPISEPHRKTPLHFWTSALFMKVLGINHFAFRLANTLYFLLCGLLVYAFANSLNSNSKNLNFGKRNEIAFRSSIIFLSSIFLMIYQRISLTDIGLLFYSLLGLFSFWKVIAFVPNLEKERNPFLKSPTLWAIIFWLSFSLGLVQKGPPILILLGGVFMSFFLFSSNRRKLIRFHAWLFLPISLIPLLVWGRLAWLASDGALIRWMVDWYILKRTTGSVFGQSGPPGYYLVLFALFLFPWSLLLPQTLISIKNQILEFLNRNVKESEDNKHLDLRSDSTESIHKDLRIFLLSWLFFGWIFYELLPSKLPSYALSVYPLFCIFLAQEWKKAEENLIPGREIFKKPKLNLALVFDWQRLIPLLLGLLWISIFLYLPYLIHSTIFNWANSNQVIGTICMTLALIYILFELSSFRKSSLPSFTKMTIAMLSFHLSFGLFYYPSLSEQRDYGNKLAEMYIEMNTSNKYILGDTPIIIHPEIRLPSIITGLDEKGISIQRIKVASGTEEIIAKINSSVAIYLAPQSFLDVIQFIGHRPASKCLEFYSYESGKNLNLCWFLSGY
ncbi:MAG: hypothetical protein MH321_01215 [Leptospiraceae bacterium]|nr:hypothetical protein [Leptospiraceae bacterium]